MPFALAACGVLAMCATAKGQTQAAPIDDGWNNLSRVSHSTSLTFIQKDGACEYGTVLKVDGTHVTIERYGKNPITMQKTDLLQVGERGGSHNAVYSGRSSWTDVISAEPGHAESLLIATKGGTKFNGKPISITDTAAVLKTLTGTETLTKQDISTVDYVRQKPLTDGEEQLAQEAPILLFFSPMSYVRAAGASVKLKVRLYDASLPENNSALTCSPMKPVESRK